MGERLSTLRSKNESAVLTDDPDRYEQLAAAYLKALAAQDMRYWRVAANGQSGGVDDEYDEETRKSIGQMKRVHRLRSLIVPESG
jgi:hypothetical protein